MTPPPNPVARCSDPRGISCSRDQGSGFSLCQPLRRAPVTCLEVRAHASRSCIRTWHEECVGCQSDSKAARDRRKPALLARRSSMRGRLRSSKATRRALNSSAATTRILAEAKRSKTSRHSSCSAPSRCDGTGGCRRRAARRAADRGGELGSPARAHSGDVPSTHRSPSQGASV